MQRIPIYVMLFIVLTAGLMLLYRVFHHLTRIDGKISHITVEPYYLMHKDSNHYAVTFQIGSPSNRLGFYVGDTSDVLKNNTIALLDTAKFYTIRIDQTKDSSTCVREITLNGKSIYRESQTLNLFLGITFTILAIVGISFKLIRRKYSS